MGALGWKQRPTLGCVLSDTRKEPEIGGNTLLFSWVRHRKNFLLRTRREVMDPLPEGPDGQHSEWDWLNSPWAGEQMCPQALPGQALPEATANPNGSFSPWMWSLLDLKEGSLTQPSVLVFSRNSWYRFSMSGHQLALGRA